MTAQPPEMNAAQARAEAVRKYFTKTPAGPSYFLAIMLGLVAAVFALITLWIVIATVKQRAQTPLPPPAPQQSVQPQPSPSPAPQPTRRGKRRRRGTEQQPPAQTTTQSATTPSTATQPARTPEPQQALSCASCASVTTASIAVISGLLAAAAYVRRRRAYVRAWNNAEPKLGRPDRRMASRRPAMARAARAETAAPWR